VFMSRNGSRLNCQYCCDRTISQTAARRGRVAAQNRRAESLPVVVHGARWSNPGDGPRNTV